MGEPLSAHCTYFFVLCTFHAALTTGSFFTQYLVPRTQHCFTTPAAPGLPKPSANRSGTAPPARHQSPDDQQKESIA
jgi:hypothetical protein